MTTSTLLNRPALRAALLFGAGEEEWRAVSEKQGPSAKCERPSNRQPSSINEPNPHSPLPTLHSPFPPALGRLESIRQQLSKCGSPEGPPAPDT